MAWLLPGGNTRKEALPLEGLPYRRGKGANPIPLSLEGPGSRSTGPASGGGGEWPRPLPPGGRPPSPGRPRRPSGAGGPPGPGGTPGRAWGPGSTASPRKASPQKQDLPLHVGPEEVLSPPETRPVVRGQEALRKPPSEPEDLLPLGAHLQGQGGLPRLPGAVRTTTGEVRKRSSRAWRLLPEENRRGIMLAKSASWCQKSKDMAGPLPGLPEGPAKVASPRRTPRGGLPPQEPASGGPGGRR